MRCGRLTVIGRASNVVLPSGVVKTMWHCKCDCGNEKDVWSHSLLYGLTKSCGCLQKEVVVNRNTTHGMAGTRLNRIFSAMKTRCYNESFPEYQNYGGRGIKICDEWLDDPSSFYNWANMSGYMDDLSIDRIDVNGNYCPENCRWSDRTAQANNKTNNIILSYNNETHTMAEWAKIIGIDKQTLKDRIRRYGWSVEDALTKPVRIDSRNKSRHS